jgi:hypothetical protein
VRELVREPERFAREPRQSFGFNPFRLFGVFE